VLRQANDVLEERVTARTAELSEANSRLLALSAELQRKNAELRQSNDDLERFAYIASHDLQEPLRMVSAYAELLGRRYRGRLDSEADEINFLTGGARRMQELVAAVLEFSRAVPPPQLRAVDANEALLMAQANLTQELREHNAVVHSSDLPLVSADRTQLMRVFQNLLSPCLAQVRQ
jgi:light-regulated signal transduction histidine kinase (bacteriophytochrome)